MTPRTLPPLLALVFLVAALPTAPAAPDEGGGIPYLVGFTGGPPSVQYLDAPVERVDEALSFAVVRVRGDAAAFEARALHDPHVRYVRVDAADAYRAASAPNDPLAPAQWAWSRVNASAAWDVTLGSTQVVVAVLDSGVERTHPDLAGPRLLAGYDFANRDRDPTDDCGHGTHVTGTLAATTGNGIGVAGAAQVRILPVKVLNSYCAGSWSSVASGIRYAADQGARVISMSLGCGVSCYDQAAADAIDYAWAKGAVVIVAAGNEGPCEACVQFPANHPRAIAVACSDEQDAICPFSSRGPGVIVAPGRNILSTVRGGGYGWNNGTSMSAPHVAGAAALAISAQPALSHAQVRALLASTAKDLGAAGNDATFGYGRLDMGALLAAARVPPPEPIPPSEALSLSPALSSASVAKGGTARHTLTLTNTGIVAASVAVNVAGVSGGWKASLDRSTLVLDPGDVAELVLSVKAPRSARSGEALALTVTAVSTHASATATARTTVT